MSSRTLVYPGDSIGVAEEFVPGEGTYEEDGEVFAATPGYLELDTTDFVARVHAFAKPPAVVKPGDVILGTVRMTRGSMAAVEIRSITAQPGRAVGGDTNGTLHVAKAADRYIDSMEDYFRARDIVRAEVLETEPSVQLTTKAPHLGVLKSWCARCGTVMARKGQGLLCPECGWKENSVLADDYGKGNIL